MHPVHIAPASHGRVSPFSFIGNQMLSNASHLLDGAGRDTQAFATDKSIRIKKRYYRNATTPGLKKGIGKTLRVGGIDEDLGAVIEVTYVVIRHATAKRQ